MIVIVIICIEPCLSISGGYTEVGENFNPEVGFLSRRGYRKYEGGVRYQYRPDNLWGLHELGRLPRRGERLELGGITFKVTRGDRRRIHAVEVTRPLQESGD